MTAWTKKKEAEFRRLDRKVLNGKASRKEILRAIELKRERPPSAVRAELEESS